MFATAKDLNRIHQCAAVGLKCVMIYDIHLRISGAFVVACIEDVQRITGGMLPKNKNVIKLFNTYDPTIHFATFIWSTVDVVMYMLPIVAGMDHCIENAAFETKCLDCQTIQAVHDIKKLTKLSKTRQNLSDDELPVSLRDIGNLKTMVNSLEVKINNRLTIPEQDGKSDMLSSIETETKEQKKTKSKKKKKKKNAIKKKDNNTDNEVTPFKQFLKKLPSLLSSLNRDDTKNSTTRRYRIISFDKLAI